MNLFSRATATHKLGGCLKIIDAENIYGSCYAMCIIYYVHVQVNSYHIALKLLQMWENVLAAYIGSWVHS